MAAMSVAEASKAEASIAEASRLSRGPRRVFVIAGHGSERPGSFVLPIDCDVIVKMGTCDVATEVEFENALNGLLSLPEEAALYPLQHMNQITQRMGSVMTYSRHQPRINGTEGSCVNLMYHLMMMHFIEDARGKMVEIFYDMGSGIIDLARWKAARKYVGPQRVAIARQRLPGMPPSRHHHTADNIEMIGGLFEHSVYPTMDMIETYLKIKWKGQEEVELYDMLDDLRTLSLVNVTQNFLCHHFPGVYYHMICRSIAGNVGENVKGYVKQWRNWKKGNAAVNVKRVAANPLFDRRFFTESVRRRHAFHRYYHSPLFQEKEHAMNMANCRNLEARITSMEGRLAAVDPPSTNAEKAALQRKIQFLRTIRNSKRAQCARREATSATASSASSASSAAAVRRNHTRRNHTRRNGSRSPRENRSNRHRPNRNRPNVEE